MTAFDTLIDAYLAADVMHMAGAMAALLTTLVVVVLSVQHFHDMR